MRAIAANEGRYPISAQCRLLGVARSTYYSMRSRADRPAAPDPAVPAVVAAHAASKGRYGSRKIKASLERSGVTVSRRRVCRIMRENGLVSAYGRKRFKVHVSVNIIFTIFTNVFSPIAPTRMCRIRQRGCAAFGV